VFKPEFRKRVEPLVPKFVLGWVDPFHSALNRRLERAARALPAGALVLDAGAGECRHAAWFAHTRYLTMDRGIGDEGWDYSRIRVLGDLHGLPFRNGVFDAVVSIQVLEHLQEPGEGIREMARVLKPGGQLILTTVQHWEIHQEPNDFFRFTRYGLAYLFEKADLEECKVEGLGGYFWLLASRLMNVLRFFQRGWRWAVFVVLAPVVGLLLPTVLYFLDRLDGRREDTLGYFCWCRKRAD
jgi:SAM-dependent methyltransferase